MLHSIPGSRGEGSDPPGYCQTTKVTLTKSSPERSGYMHIAKQVTTVHVHWNYHGSSAYVLASMPEPKILQKLQSSSSLS